MAVSSRIQNFASLVENNFYKVVKVETFKTDFTANQVIYTLLDGRRLFGRSGVNEIFKTYVTPFYFQFKGLSENGLFRSYKFNTYRNVEEVLTETYREILQILMSYITSKACMGCLERQPNQMAHICVTESRMDLCKNYLAAALEEQTKYQLGDILEAFIDYEASNF